VIKKVVVVAGSAVVALAPALSLVVASPQCKAAAVNSGTRARRMCAG